MASRKQTPTNDRTIEKDAADQKEQKSALLAKKRWIVVFFGLAVGIGFFLGTGDVLRNTDITETDPLTDFINRQLIPAFNDSFSAFVNYTYGDSSPRPGQKLASQGAKHPVVMIPGFVTSGLELWESRDCLDSESLFRQRIWGGTSMARAFLHDRECWREHLALHPFTGLDPEKIRVRGAIGFEAADYFISSYWVFGKLIQNFADIGYDANSMAMMSYDWRLAFPQLEKRDHFLTDLKVKIESFHEILGEKVVLLSHSMGTNLCLFFFRWVTTPKEQGGGGGGTDWLEKHVHSYINMAGPILGLPKSVSALLSGEMADTAMLGKLGSLLEDYFGRKRRKDLFATWGSLWSMIPKGGDAIWSTGADICTEEEVVGYKCGTEEKASEDAMIRFTDSEARMTLPVEPQESDGKYNVCTSEVNEDDDMPLSTQTPAFNKLIEDFASSRVRTAEETLKFLLNWGAGYGPKLHATRHHSFKSHGMEASDSPIIEEWHNPIATPLPNAPSVKFYCLYGVGIQTETGFYYKKAPLTTANNGDDNATDNEEQTCKLDGDWNDPPFAIDVSVADVASNVKAGIRFTDGDLTVPLVSLGYMCVDGWGGGKPNRLNPSNIQVVTKEYAHEEQATLSDPMRGGTKSGQHVDILGNTEFLADILKVASGFEADTVSQRILSNIEGIARKINSHKLGGLNYMSDAENDVERGRLEESRKNNTQ